MFLSFTDCNGRRIVITKPETVIAIEAYEDGGYGIGIAVGGKSDSKQVPLRIMTRIHMQSATGGIVTVNVTESVDEVSQKVFEAVNGGTSHYCKEKE